MRRWQKVVLWIVGVVLAVALVAVGGFVYWGMTPSQPQATAMQALTPDSRVSVTDNAGAYVLTPTSVEPSAGVIFYPGGHVDARAYAPIARGLAEQGFLVAIPRVPLALAFFRVDAAADVMAAYPDIHTWVVGGHSLGGVAAAMFADKNPDKVDGMFFLASYPAQSNDLSDQLMPVVTIRGEYDGNMTAAQQSESLSRLPADADLIELAGGNHGQFGDYGPQPGDNPATLSPQRQTDQTVEAIAGVVREALGSPQR